MNRAQRRAQGQDKPITMNYGHSNTHIVVQFSQAVMDVSLTPEQCDAMRAALLNAKRRLMQHQAAQEVARG